MKDDNRPTMFMIPSGALGEKYVKMISGNETMTVQRYADEMAKRAEQRAKEIDELINNPLGKSK